MVGYCALYDRAVGTIFVIKCRYCCCCCCVYFALYLLRCFTARYFGGDEMLLVGLNPISGGLGRGSEHAEKNNRLYMSAITM